MIPMRLAEIAAVVDGEVHGPPGAAEVVVSGPAFHDSRAPEPAGLYVAVVGERVDGHDFAAGAHAVLGSRPTDAPTVVVADPVRALGRLARHVVAALPARVSALTGSAGKTSTKDLLAQVLAADGPTVATRANANNELGVPLTALRADPATRHLVVEMGARGGGHLAYLCDLVPPTVSAVLNVGTAHIGEFGSREGIARAKGELVEALPAEGTAVLNADDPLVSAMAARTRARVLTFGEHADVRWRGVSLDDRGHPRFELGHDGVWAPVALQVTGWHQVPNAGAAAAVALARGLALDTVAAGLSAAVADSRWRMELHDLPSGTLLVNDAYNASPDSVIAALSTLADLGRRRGGRAVAVLGVMLELGEEHVPGHTRVGTAAGELGLDAVVVIGDDAAAIAAGARAAGVGEVIVTASREDAAAWVRENAGGLDVVLVKASRGAALERVVEQLLEGDAPAS